MTHSLSAYFDRFDRLTRSITVYAPPPRPDLVDRLEAIADVDAVEYRPLPGATADGQAFLVVDDDGEFVAAISLESVREFLEPPIYEPWADALDDAIYQRVVEVFASTVWHTLERRQLLAVSREIENRAWRVGSGTLRAGFQRASAFESMAPAYDRLATESVLDIHVYIDDEWTRSSIPGVTIHADAGDEIGTFWFLAYDGDGDELWTGGLLARETDVGEFEGLWTDDARLVAALERAILESAG